MTEKPMRRFYQQARDGFFFTQKRKICSTESLPRSPLSKVLSKKRPQFAKWTFDKKRKGNYENTHLHTAAPNEKQNLAYILPLKGTNLSIISKTSFKKPSFAFTEWELGWLALSLAAFIFMVSLLFLILSPLFSAYTQLKNALSQYSLKGEMPFISSHNPFLRFYLNVWNASQNKKQEEEKVPMKDSMKERLTFRNILDSAQERLKERFPGLSIQKDLQTNVSLWYFAPLMRKNTFRSAFKCHRIYGRKPKTVHHRQIMGRGGLLCFYS